MRSVNDNNRYYCHRKLKELSISVKKKQIEVDYKKLQSNKYIERLRDFYGYTVQLFIS